MKAVRPKKFDGTPAKANLFISRCENYFILSPMNDNQQIRFALGLMEGKAESWTMRQLQLLCRVPQPAHFATWANFVNEFNDRFVDAQEQKKALARLWSGEVVQTSSARLFINQLQEIADKAGVTDDFQRMTFISLGLKEEVNRAMASYEPLNLADLICTAIRIDENLQRLKTRANPRKAFNKKAICRK